MSQVYCLLDDWLDGEKMERNNAGSEKDFTLKDEFCFVQYCYAVPHGHSPLEGIQ